MTLHRPRTSDPFRAALRCTLALVVALAAGATRGDPEAPAAGASGASTSAGPVASSAAPRDGLGAPAGMGSPQIPPEIPSDLSLHPLELSPAPRKSVWIPALETATVMGFTMAWNKWVGRAEWANITAGSVERNLSSPWVFDNDQYWINEFGHPYQGTWSYTAARSAGLSFWPATLFPLAESTVWELVGETERPSINDQFTTTIGSIVLGEAMFRAAGMLLRDRGVLRSIAATLLAPFGPVNRHVLGDWNEAPTNPTRLRAWVGAMAFAPERTESTAMGKGAVPDVGIRLEYGPAGDPETRFEKPFDHFTLNASYGWYLDPVAVIIAQGLLFGSQFEGPTHRGLWGLVVGFDMITPWRYRITTVNLGVGTETRFFLGEEAAVDVDLAVAAVPMGVGGYVTPGTGGNSRDYHLGGGAQGSLDLHLFAGSRTEVEVGLRQYVVLGARDSYGTERMTYASAGALVRLFGPHAIGTDATFLFRSATTFSYDPAVRNDGTILRLFYAYAPEAPIAPVASSDLARR